MIKLYAYDDKEIEVKFWKFPAGETGVKLLDIDINRSWFDIHLYFESNDDIINLMFLYDAIKESHPHATSFNLYIKYLPYARQDRYCSPGESFSLRVFANILNSMDFYKIHVDDLHSEVMKGLVPAGKLVINEQFKLQENCVADIIRNYHSMKTAIIAPDAGAVKKAAKAAIHHKVDLVEFTKQRDPKDGTIKKINCSIDKNELLQYDSLIVVDDICDNGGTFIALGNVIRNEYNFKGSLHLVVTHGIFGKGLSELYEYYNSIDWINAIGNKEIN